MTMPISKHVETEINHNLKRECTIPIDHLQTEWATEKYT